MDKVNRKKHEAHKSMAMAVGCALVHAGEGRAKKALSEIRKEKKMYEGYCSMARLEDDGGRW